MHRFVFFKLLFLKLLYPIPCCLFAKRYGYHTIYLGMDVRPINSMHFRTGIGAFIVISKYLLGFYVFCERSIPSRRRILYYSSLTVNRRSNQHYRSHAFKSSLWMLNDSRLSPLCVPQCLFFLHRSGRSFCHDRLFCRMVDSHISYNIVRLRFRRIFATVGAAHFWV